MAYDDSDLKRVAGALKGKQMANGDWSCRCPAHEDRHASLSLGLRDGKILWKCHAGCTQDAVRDALAGQGLIEAGKRSTGTEGTASGRHLSVVSRTDEPKASLGKIVATYDYVDVTGNLLFQVVRFQPKTFRQRRPKGNGWDWGLGRTQPVIYRLPEVLAAEIVCVVEGEKDVERLRALKLTATCNPMGAGKWRSDYGESLAGKHVVILPDNDEPGRKHAEDVAASARDHGARSIRIVDLPRQPEHGDICDWIDAGNDRAKLEELVRSTPLWTESVAAGDPGWRSRLIQGDQGPKGNEANVALALEEAPDLAGRVRFDAFRTAVQLHDMPWDPRPEWRDWTDSDDVHLATWVQRHDIDFPSHRMIGVVSAVAQRAETHPVRDYLDGLKWDGTPRIDSWLTYYLGAAPSSLNADEGDEGELIAAFAAKWLISAVARVFNPGAKADHALILEGGQGIGKSTAMRVLAGEDFFTDQIADFGSKDSCHDLRGKWVIEISELSAMRRAADIERVKSFMSRNIDHYRPSFGRRSVDIPRQCVFVGTTNADVYLHDATGNRRFWPVQVTSVDTESLERDRDQLWAEAVHRYRQGEPWWLPRELNQTAEKVQAGRVEDDTWSSFVMPYLNGRQETTTREILVHCIGKDKRDITRADETRVGALLRQHGFRSCYRRHQEYGSRIYQRCDHEPAM